MNARRSSLPLLPLLVPLAFACSERQDDDSLEIPGADAGETEDAGSTDASTPDGNDLPDWELTLHAKDQHGWAGARALAGTLLEQDPPESDPSLANLTSTSRQATAEADGAEAEAVLDLLLEERSFTLRGNANISVPADRTGALASAVFDRVTVCVKARGAKKFRFTVACSGYVESLGDAMAAIEAKYDTHVFCRNSHGGGQEFGWISPGGDTLEVDAPGGVFCPAAGELSLALMVSGGELPEKAGAAVAQGELTVTIEPIY